MTVPSKTWTRSRVPSTTRAETLTVSPAASSGMSVRICSWLISSSKFTIDPYSSCGGATALRWLCGPQPGRGKGASEKAAKATDGERYHNGAVPPSRVATEPGSVRLWGGRLLGANIGQEARLLPGLGSAVEQVGTTTQGPAQSLLETPLPDDLVVAAR